MSEPWNVFCVDVPGHGAHRFVLPREEVAAMLLQLVTSTGAEVAGVRARVLEAAAGACIGLCWGQDPPLATLLAARLVEEDDLLRYGTAVLDELYARSYRMAARTAMIAGVLGALARHPDLIPSSEVDARVGFSSATGSAGSSGSTSV